MYKLNINVNNEKELKKFYKFLPFYKSFIFKIFKFDIKSKYDDIKTINTALNIKNRKMRITYIFDMACKQVDDTFKDIKNPCGFKNGICYSHSSKKLNKINGCCRCCKYQSSNGCTTKNLTCKLFFCDEVKKRYKVIEFDDLKILKLLSIRQRYILKSDYFSSREDVINDLYYGSFIIASIRILSRLIPNLIYVKINNK